MTRTIAVDFDGTICTNKFPLSGDPNNLVIEALQREKGQGSKIILWTCREGALLDKSLAACRDWGLTFDAVNESTDEWKEFYGNDPRKPGADEYWDDRAVRADEYGIKTHEREYHMVLENQCLRGNIQGFLKRLAKAENRIKLLANGLFDSGFECACDLCVYNIRCTGKDCVCYESGEVDFDGVKHKWDCCDYEYGECRVLKNTPCNGCNFENHFKWNGK